jgi:two-component system response regulator AtoC
MKASVCLADFGIVDFTKHGAWHEAAAHRLEPAMSSESPGDALVTEQSIDQDLLSRPRLLAIWRGAYASAPLPPDSQVRIGRGLANELRVGAESVSREHALVLAGEPACIVDTDSATGVHVDGIVSPPGEPTPIAPGNIVELGDAFLLLQHAVLGPASAGGDGLAPPASSRSQRTTRVDVLETAVERVRRLELPSARLQRLADVIASTALSVLVVGEAGVGRATLAKRVHRRSPRAELPFLSIECAALAGSGSSASLSLIRDVRGGTVLLENVSELPLQTQAQLLEVVGGPSQFDEHRSRRTLDARLVATCSRDLRELVAAGSFRSDLYLRLGGVQLFVPPLRDRPGEILPLAHQFLVEAGSRSSLPVPEITAEVRSWLELQPWPGNLLELRSVMRRALSLSQGQPLTLEHVRDAREFAPPADDRGPITLRDKLPDPDRPTNPFASTEPFTPPGG